MVPNSFIPFKMVKLNKDGHFCTFGLQKNPLILALNLMG